MVLRPVSDCMVISLEAGNVSTNGADDTKGHPAGINDPESLQGAFQGCFRLTSGGRKLAEPGWHLLQVGRKLAREGRSRRQSSIANVWDQVP